MATFQKRGKTKKGLYFPKKNKLLDFPNFNFKFQKFEKKTFKLFDLESCLEKKKRLKGFFQKKAGGPLRGPPLRI